MAPVAGRIADRQEDWFILRPRLGERGRPPWEPIHGIVRMLAEVWTGLVDQPISRERILINC